MNASRGVLVTRPEPGLAETMAQVAALGWQPWAAPALGVAHRNVAFPAGLAAVLLTSSQSVPALAACPDREVPLFAVGDATARRAMEAGFSAVESAQGDADALTSLVLKRCRPDAGAVLLLSGAGQGDALARTLREAGYRVIRRVAYEARPIHDVPEEALAALRAGEIGVLLSFSEASAAASLTALHGEARLSGLLGVAISERAAAVLRQGGLCEVRVAARPDAASVIAALGEFTAVSR